jgi:hypothetical protein
MDITGEITYPKKADLVFQNALLAKIATITVPVLTILTLVLAIFSSTSGASIGLMLAGILVISRIILFVYRDKMKELTEKFSFNSNQYEQFLNVFSHIENENFTEELNQSLQNKLRSGKSKSSRKEIEKLARLLRNFESVQSNIGLILNNLF